MQKIDIRTTQNVSIEYELASLRERIMASFIDGVIVIGIYLVIWLLLANTLRRAMLSSGITLYVINTLLPIGTFILYQLLSEVLADGQSWGKKSMRIKVVRLDGKEPGLSDYLLRAIFHIIDSIFSIGIVAAMLISSSDKNQRLGDMTANTTVIRVRPNLRFKLEDILRINSLADYEPKYPEVRQLSEQDMLLIKNVVARYRNYPNSAHKARITELVDHLRKILGIQEQPANQVEFLKALIRDYIVLTR